MNCVRSSGRHPCRDFISSSLQGLFSVSRRYCHKGRGRRREKEGERERRRRGGRGMVEGVVGGREIRDMERERERVKEREKKGVGDGEREVGEG